MPKGQRERRRPADTIATPAMVVKIAAREDTNTSYVSQKCRIYGVEGAEARMETLSAVGALRKLQHRPHRLDGRGMMR